MFNNKVMRICIYYFSSICRNVLWFWWVYVPKSLFGLLWEILKVWFNIGRGFFKNSIQLVIGFKKRIGASMGCCPSKSNTNYADNGSRRGFNRSSSSRPVVDEQPRSEERKSNVSQHTGSQAKRTEVKQSKKHLDRPPRMPNERSKMKFDNSGLSFTKIDRDNSNKDTSNRQQSLQPKTEIENVPLSKVRNRKIEAQNSDFVDKLRVTTTIPKLNNKDFTAVDIEKDQSPMNNQLTQPKIKEPLSPQQSYLKKSINSDNQVFQPMKANIGQISEHNRSFLDQILSEQKEPSTAFDILMKNNETNCSVSNEAFPSYTNNKAGEFEAKMLSATSKSCDSQQYSSFFDQLLSEQKEPSTAFDILMKSYCSVSTKNGANPSYTDNGNFEAKRPASNLMTYESHVVSKSTMQSHQDFASFSSHSYHISEPPQKPERTSHHLTEEAKYRKSDETDYQESNDNAVLIEQRNIDGFSEKYFSSSPNQIVVQPNDVVPDVYEKLSMLDQGCMNIDCNEATKIIPQKPRVVVDNRDYVPVFRDYIEIDENDLFDDLTESKINSKTYNQMIEMLNKIYGQAKPFHEKIDEFTELEHSNEHYYIEESLRRCIDKLDDMYDDIGDVKALREERKKVYKFVFPMFDRLDAKVQENKLKIDGQKE